MSNAGILNTFANILRNSWRPQIEAKRFRYWKEMREKGYNRRYDWVDKMPRGLLPRSEKMGRIIPCAIYRPKNSFASKRAYFGQNDYIDILGDGNLHPARIVPNVPSWLKTFRGNEYQRLLRKEKMFRRGTYPLTRPTKWSKMKSRIDWLWYELNYRRKIF